MPNELVNQMKQRLKNDEETLQRALSNLNLSECKRTMSDLTTKIKKRQVDGSYELIVSPTDNVEEIDKFNTLLKVKDFKFNQFKEQIIELAEFEILNLVTNDDINIKINIDEIDDTLESILKVIIILGKQIKVTKMDEILLDIGKIIASYIFQMKDNIEDISDSMLKVYLSDDKQIGYCALKFTITDITKNPFSQLFKKNKSSMIISCQLLVFKVKKFVLSENSMIKIESFLSGYKIIKDDLSIIDKLLFIENVKIEMYHLELESANI
jgi:hypothetical protein